MPRDEVVYTYVVENDQKQITDLISFYCLPSSVLKHEKHKKLKVSEKFGVILQAAYAFYNVATTVTFTELMENALILANKEEFDVFNALNIMDNDTVFKVF